jgi:DNA polymerase-3 subunit alpha
MEQKFVHLRLHTEYSLSDGLLTIPGLIKKASIFSMPAIAITDLSNLYATVKFYQSAIDAGIKPLIGVDLWLADDKKTKESTRITLLCQTHEGYKNLLKLVSKSYLEGQANGTPLIQKSWLQSLSEGLIALSGG